MPLVLDQRKALKEKRKKETITISFVKRLQRVY